LAVDKKNSPTWYKVVVWIVLVAFVLGFVVVGALEAFKMFTNKDTSAPITTSSQEKTAAAQIAAINTQFQAQVATKKAAQKAKPNDFTANSELGLAYSLWAQTLQATGDTQALGEATARFTDAVPFLKIAYGIKPTDADTANGYVLALAYSGNVTQALTVAREVTTKIPADANAWFNLGSLLAGSNEANAKKDAIAAFRTAKELDSSGTLKAQAQQQIDTLSSAP